MALTTTEEAQVRQLIDQNAALLSLASNEPTIISKLAAAKISLADLTAASSLNGSDLLLIRQGTQEKSVTQALLTPDASETVKGIIELATSAETQAGTSTSLAVHPAGLASALAGAGSSVSAAFSKLSASATGTNASVLVTADELVVKNASNQYKTLSAVNVTINTASTGANGLDTGTLATSTWYALYIIWNGTTTAGLISLSSTAPTMPSGYTHKARVGWIRTDGTANKYPLGFTQKGNYVTLLIGSANVTTPPLMASGTAGTFSAAVFTSVAVAWANYAPSTSRKIRIGMSANNTGMVIGIASNPNRTGFATANPPELGYDSNAYPLFTFGDLQLESSNVYWASSGAAIGYLLSGGWEDNL